MQNSGSNPPDGWITRGELIAATGVSDRNLLNWCAAGFVPRPMRQSHGSRGSSAFYRAEAVHIILRLRELQQKHRDADIWLWALWLDPADYPIDIQLWVLQRLEHALAAIEAIGNDPNAIERSIDSSFERGKLRAGFRKRGANSEHLREMLLWAYRVAADIEQLERLDNPGSPILDTLRRFGGLPEKGFPVPDRALGVELLSISWLREVTQQASPDGLEQLRRDCRAIDHLAELAKNIDWRAAQPAVESTVRSIIGSLPEPPSVRARKEARKRSPVPVVARFFVSMWEDLDVRAILACGLIAFRRSPEHGSRLTEVLALGTLALELGVQLSKGSES
jgi:hypothetical protein